MNKIRDIEEKLGSYRKSLADLDEKREWLIQKIGELEGEREYHFSIQPDTEGYKTPPVTTKSHHSEKIVLFRSLFKGREDVYPLRFESLKTGKSGYQPACENEWIPGICEKPRVKCADCENRKFMPVTDKVIRNHLLGYDPDDPQKGDFTIGVYPLLTDENCNFLAVDFDKRSWKEDAAAYLGTCREYSIPAVLERSRSGYGGHVWIFFSEPVLATTARKMGTYILTETMERRPEIGFDSYDRLFPNQDTMPKGGFGNLIVLPLQAKPRESGNSVFIDETFTPHPDQWAFLSSIQTMSLRDVESIAKVAVQRGKVVGVKTVLTDEYDVKPWTAPPSKKPQEKPITGILPETVNLVLGNQIYIEKGGLPPELLNRLIRLAAFQNPEFYRAQAMRLSTWNKPRIISCHEDFPGHIGLPRGCLEDVLGLLKSLKIKPDIVDERVSGDNIEVIFQGDLRPQQEKAARILLEYETGVLSASTAFGKTIIGIYLIAKRRVNTLILVHRRHLMDQWVARLSGFLSIDPKYIGQIGGGKHKPTGMIDVATIQSLSRKGVVDDIVGEYGHLIVDECHHISARSFEIVARQSKAKYVLGLSATVIRKDGHHPIIFMNIGPVRYRVDDRKQAQERPFTHHVIFRKTDYVLPKLLSEQSDLAIHEIYSSLLSDSNRNELIVRDIIEAVKERRSPVVLTERREHLELLEKHLSAEVKNVFMLKGGMGKKQIRLVLEKLACIPDDEPRVIISTGRYLGEGFDDERLDTLFLTLPVSWKGVLAQYAGRLHRLHDKKKEVIIYDYLDSGVVMLDRMYKRRLSGYRAIGYSLSLPTMVV